MHSDLYFILGAIITSDGLPEPCVRMALGGDFKTLEKTLAAATEADAGQAPRYEIHQAYADIQLLFGRYEEAEQSYRHALKLIYGDRQRYRRKSCRNAAWQALAQHRCQAALAGFKRLTEENGACHGERFEALLGLGLAVYRTGHVVAAWEHLELAHDLAQACARPAWSELVAVMKYELSLQFRLRSHPSLADHVFWHSATTDFIPPGLRDAGPPSPATGSSSLLASCMDFFRCLEAGMADGRADALSAIKPHLPWERYGSTRWLRTRHLTIAMAALCVGLPALGQRMLEHAERDSAYDRISHWHLDYLYCLAALMRKQGSWRQFEETYTRYAMLSMQHARSCSHLSATVGMLHNGNAPIQVKAGPAADDIPSRLIGKYRRAYAYIVENLQQPDLSVKEIAAHIGVTQRTLQLTFRHSLGLTPMELIRQLRMERIRTDLLAAGSARDVMSVASKWGVRHRSTLAAGYRRTFRESPSETVMRGG